VRGFVYSLVGLLFPLLLLLVKVVGAATEEQLGSVFPVEVLPWVVQFCRFAELVGVVVPEDYRYRS
jgi:hypothetical protein